MSGARRLRRRQTDLSTYECHFPNAELWTEELRVAEPLTLKNDRMDVKLDMYSAKAREGAISALTQPMGCSNKDEASLQGLQGSFRKLEVD